MTKAILNLKKIPHIFFLLFFLANNSLLLSEDKQNEKGKEQEPAKEEVKYLPGGDEVKRLVEARKGKTELSKLAMKMEPGTWALLNVEVPKGLWSAPQPSKGLHIGTWSDDGHWDSRTGQFFYFGVRQARKFVAYSEEKNEWRVIEFDKKPNAPELMQQYGHQYSCNSFDPEKSRFFTYFQFFDIQKNEWSSIPSAPKNLCKSSMTFEYFSAMDGLLTLGKDPAGVVSIYSEEKKTWTNLGKTSLPGYHSLARHNPYLKEVLLAGGNDSRTIVVLSKEGTLTQKKNFPVDLEKFTIRSTILTVDPLSGRYLFLIPDKKFIEYDSIKDEYRLIDDFSKTPWPFDRYDSPLVAHIPEYGVTIWAAGKTHIYKHKICTSKPIELNQLKVASKKEKE